MFSRMHSFTLFLFLSLFLFCFPIPFQLFSVSVDLLATLAMIQSRPCQQADQQHLMFITRSLYPIAIDRDRRTPLAHSLPSMPSSSLSPSVCVPSPKVLVPHLFCSRKPRTLIANVSIAMPQHRSLPFATHRYTPSRPPLVIEEAP